MLCTWRIGLEGHRIVLGIRNRLVLIEKHDRQDSQWHCLSQSCIQADLSWETPAKSWSLPWSTIEFFKKKKELSFSFILILLISLILLRSRTRTPQIGAQIPEY
jgi:hypothetical protein